MSTESPERKHQDNGAEDEVAEKEITFFAVPFDAFVNVEALSELRRALTKEEKQEVKRILKEELKFLTRNEE